MSDTDVKKDEQPVKEPVVSFVNKDGRSKVVPLDWPFDLDGERIDSVTIVRCSAQEVTQYIQAMIDAEQNDTPVGILPPMIACSIDVWNSMDDDDQTKIDEASRDFTPRRLLRLLGVTDEQASINGENTSA